MEKKSSLKILKAAFLGAILAIGGALNADRIILRDGSELDGEYIDQNSEGVSFRTRDGRTRRVAADSIAELQLGVSGLEFCYRLVGEAETLRCDVRLSNWSETHAELVQSDGRTDMRYVPVSQFAFVEIRAGASQNIVDFVRSLRGSGEVKLRNRVQVRGEIELRSNVFYITTSDGRQMRLAGAALARIAFEPRTAAGGLSAGGAGRPGAFQLDSSEPLGKAHPAAPDAAETDPSAAPSDFEWLDLFPGWRQRRQGERLYGGGLSAAFGFSVAYSAYSLQAARQASAVGAADPTVILFYNTGPRGVYNRHLMAMRASGVLAAALFAWNLGEILVWDAGPSAGENVSAARLHLHFFPADSPRGPAHSGEVRYGASLSLHF